MAYADDEADAGARARIEAHLPGCASCTALVDEQRRLTAALAGWQVASAPDSLTTPVVRRSRNWWRPTPSIAAGLAAAAIVLVAVAVNQRSPQLSRPQAGPSKSVSLDRDMAGRQPAEPVAPSRVAGNVSGGGGGASTAFDSASPAPQSTAAQLTRLTPPSVIRTARLQIVAKDFTTARAAVEPMVTNAAGFIDHMTVTGDTTSARTLRGTLRIPSDRLSEVLDRLRALGDILDDTQGTEDVTEQIVDLEARLASSRATERRLTELLRNRTGRLSDVLEVERELTRIRLDIERLDAQKANVHRRVSYATIDVTITEQRKESIDGPVSLATRLRVAALDGLEAALDSAAAVALFALRAGPALVLWGAPAALVWLAVRRRLRLGMQDSR